jgi:hypothetical protein
MHSYVRTGVAAPQSPSPSPLGDAATDLGMGIGMGTCIVPPLGAALAVASPPGVMPFVQGSPALPLGLGVGVGGQLVVSSAGTMNINANSSLSTYASQTPQEALVNCEASLQWCLGNTTKRGVQDIKLLRVAPTSE